MLLNFTILISFGISYWGIILLAVLVASLGVAALLYFRNKATKEISKTQLLTLAVLRFLSFFFVAFLLLSPFLRNLKKITQSPVVIAAWDNSTSVVNGEDSLACAKEITRMKADLNRELGADYKVVNYSFGEKTESNRDLTFNEKQSNYSNMIASVFENHYNQNIGALIVVGDGIYNKGKNPLNMLDQVNFPIYTVGLGDTSVISDASIQNVRVNRTAFSGNKFTAEVDVRFVKLRNNSLKLSVFEGDKELESTVITPVNDNYIVTKEFVLDAGAPGLKHLSVKIEVANNEKNTKNNYRSFVINVLENKQKILIVSDGIHPDVGAIKNTLEQLKAYTVSIYTEEPYPDNIKDYNLLIINQLPTSSKSAADIVHLAKKNRLPVLFIIGNKTFLPQLNVLNQGVKIEPMAGNPEQAQSSYNPGFGTFSFSEDLIELVPQLPPLQVPFAHYSIDPMLSTVFYQRLKGIETAYPLIAVGKVDGRKTGFVFGEGIWRWRLFDYSQNQNHDRFNELITQIVQYLALRENEDNFIINYKPVYSEIEDVVLNAELYNDAYESVSSEEINVKLKNSNNEEFNFTFDAQGENYVLNAGHLPLGDYSFSAEVTVGKETYSENGSFTIVPVTLENIATQANHHLLYLLSESSGGQFYLPAQFNNLLSDLQSKNKLQTTSYFQEMITELINLRWIFIVFIFLLSVEWFLRKYWGLY
jgi:hypothetical protein